jgi:hypothetical protein
VTAPKDKSATTVAKLAIFPETVHPRLAASVLATSASNPDTSRLNARTKSFSKRQAYNEDLRALRRLIDDSTLPKKRCYACKFTKTHKDDTPGILKGWLAEHFRNDNDDLRICKWKAFTTPKFSTITLRPAFLV